MGQDARWPVLTTLVAAFAWVFLVVGVQTTRTADFLTAAIAMGCKAGSGRSCRRRFAVCFGSNFVAHNQVAFCE